MIIMSFLSLKNTSYEQKFYGSLHGRYPVEQLTKKPYPDGERRPRASQTYLVNT